VEIGESGFKFDVIMAVSDTSLLAHEEKSAINRIGGNIYNAPKIASRTIRDDAMDVDGDRIKELRLSQMLTQVELANAAKMTESTINRLEKNLQKARISTVRSVALALGVDPSEILRQKEKTRRLNVSDDG